MEGDGAHWLWRLDAQTWLHSAGTELRLAADHATSRRKALTHCRRAAGMALNGVLVRQAAHGWSRERCETVWGRSYVDHLRALGATATNCEPFDVASQEVAEAARSLMEIPLQPGAGLISLRRGTAEGVEGALLHCGALVDACRRIVGGEPTPRPN
jgi:hypothetical protein